MGRLSSPNATGEGVSRETLELELEQGLYGYIELNVGCVAKCWLAGRLTSGCLIAAPGFRFRFFPNGR